MDGQAKTDKRVLKTSVADPDNFEPDLDSDPKFGFQHFGSKCCLNLT